jgi:hypothetical protein
MTNKDWEAVSTWIIIPIVIAIFSIFARGCIECGWTWRLGAMFDCGMALITKD